ncbi:MAG: hypothetical protein JWP63_113 [Candidatus Solibacter sp.]|nr:hypothetical protein [Candidatus Solibacter sp.]
MTGKSSIFAFLIMTVALCAQEPAVPAPPPSPEPNQALFGQHLQRSMALLDTSSKQRRWPVKVLIYGQSITGSSLLTKMIDTFLRQRYPFADITLENRSIGGFGADRLVRTMEHDLVSYYPDLLIFHVYGGERTGDLERIVSNVRRFTTSDIVLLNHHQNGDGKADLEFGPKVLRYLAQKYDCELVDVTANWPRYLEENHFPSTRMLRDNVHPNPDGLALLTTLVGRHLIFNPLSPSPSGMSTVRWYEARRPLEEGGTNEITFTGAPWKSDTEGVIGDAAASALRLQFEGNRIDAVEAHTKAKVVPGTAKILIDGKPPSQNPRLYAVTLPSRGPETWFPCIRRVRFESLPLVEDWTLKITEINEDATRFRFQVAGSKTGPDGEGVSTENFTSRSKRVVIESRDWMLADIMKIFKQKAPPPVGYEVKWSIVAQFTDTWKPEQAADSAKVYATTLAQGLSNGPHTLELIPNGDGPIPVEAIQVYRPPMK